MDQRELGLIMRAHPDVAALYLFGSLARGDAREDSDADVGVVLMPGRTHDWRERGDLASRLEALFPRRTIDLVYLDERRPLLGLEVLREGRLLAENDTTRRIDFESETIIRALDFAPTYALATGGRLSVVRKTLRSSS